MGTMMTEAKKTRKAKTAAELKADYEKAKAALAALEQRAFAGELDEFIKTTSIVTEIQRIREAIKGVSDLTILAAIGKAASIPRLVITQSEPKPRKPKPAA